MPDIREVLKALDETDRNIWLKHRNALRRAYMLAQAEIMGNGHTGISKWDQQDDAFTDLIDIKLALLFDKAGRFDAPQHIIDTDTGKKIEADIEDAVSQLKVSQSPAQAKLNETWQGSSK